MEEQFQAEFHGFVIDSEQGLSFAGKPISLRPKELQLLLVLVKNAGRRVSKEELIANAWNGAPVSDESISRCLSMVKSALRSASLGSEALIKTEYGQGYRFIGQVGKPASYVNEENFFLLINASRDLVILKDGEDRWQIANTACLMLYGLLDISWQGKTSLELSRLCPPNYQDCFEACAQSDEEAWNTRRPVQVSEAAIPNACDDYNPRIFEITKTPLFEADGSRKALITHGYDITDRLEGDRKIRLTNQVLASHDDAILITDAANKIVYVNDAFTRVTGYTLAEVFGQDPKILSAQRHDRDFYHDMWQRITTEGTWHGEIWEQRKNGEIYLKWLNISCVHDHNGKVCNYIGIFTDINKRKADEALLAFLAYHDPLTRLPNRILLHDRFQQAQGVANRGNTGTVALLFIDLDQFKNINDTLGHETGDRLLVAVSRRLQACVREVDTVSRLGGDEFVVVLTDVPNSHAISLVAQKILDHVHQVFEIEHHRLNISASIGIALYPDDAEDFDTLLKMADTAMYHAKNSGRNTYRFFTDQMNLIAMERLRMRKGLSAALTNQEFLLHYQPQFDLKTGGLVGLEALLRWRRGPNELISPATFIHIAEETGLINAIGEWVIRETCRQVKAWQTQGYQPVKVAINLSLLQFKRSDIVKMLADLTDEHDVARNYLELELTESLLLQDVEYMLEVIEKLKSLRFTLSIDDFGTGFSSLTHLKRLRIDKLKIDHSFVRNLEVDTQDVAIIRTIIQLARGFDLLTIAEGVETEGQLGILKREGCQLAQGYWFSHPLPADEVVRYLQSVGNGDA